MKVSEKARIKHDFDISTYGGNIHEFSDHAARKFAEPPLKWKITKTLLETQSDPMIAVGMVLTKGIITAVDAARAVGNNLRALDVRRQVHSRALSNRRQ